MKGKGLANLWPLAASFDEKETHTFDNFPKIRFIMHPFNSLS